MSRFFRSMIAASWSTRVKITRAAAVVALAVALNGCGCGRSPANEAPRDNGEECDDDGQCKSGLCDLVPRTLAKICLGKCISGCTVNEVCLNVGVNRFGCVPEREGLCAACEDDSNCPYPGDRCIAISGQKVCGRDCSFDGTCPVGFSCENGFTITGDQVPAQCHPVSGTCACTPANVGQVVPCERMNSFGRCMGVRTCEQTKYSDCMAPIPMAEVCNGADDDCNGQVDDGLPVISCGKGECMRTVATCLDGGFNQVCTPGGPVPEAPEEEESPAPAVAATGPVNLPEDADPPEADEDNPMPEYPEAARTAGLESVVILKVVIEKDGSVGRVQVMKGDEPFIASALEAVRQWRYTPAQLEGQPIAVYRIVKIPFRLRS